MVSKSACSPAPEVGSDAAKVSTRGGCSNAATGREPEVMNEFYQAKTKDSLYDRALNQKIFHYFSFPLISDFLTMANEFRTWMCLICGWIYDEAAGSPDEGIAPGTRWEDVPPNWTCPECGARKEDFEMVEL
jgi:rubredoxin